MASPDVEVYPTVPAQRVDKNGINVREDVLYSDAKGREKARLRRLADEVLEDFNDLLRRVLEPNEVVFGVATAQAMPGVTAQFFGGGWHTYSLPRSVLIFTDRRVIVLRARKRMSGWIWDRGIRTARWGDLQSVKSGGFSSRILTLQFRNGQKQAYWRFGRGELKKAVSLIDVLGPHGSGELTAVGGMVSLCPGCFAVLSPRVYQCSGCGLQFKDEGNLLRRGLLVPGGATFYVGATGLGAMRALSECILAAACVLIVLPIVFAGPEHRNVAGALLGGGFVLLLLAFDRTIAIVFSRQQVRDFLPAKTNRT